MPVPARSLPARGPYTVVYTDVDASTTLNERLGDDAARDVMRSHTEITRGALARHGGIELTHLGDGFKLAFPDAARAMAFAVDLQRSIEAGLRAQDQDRVSVRVGIHTGDAVREDDDLHGRTVIVAQRILSRAQAGQILVSETTASAGRLPEGARAVDRGLFLLKGLRDGLRLFEVLWQPEASRPARRAASTPLVRDVVPRPPLVGRHAEMAALETILQETEKGAGRVVLICGEPGIGKTRLCVEFLEWISRRDVCHAVGRAYPEQRRPYGPVLEGLAQLAGSGARRVPRSLAAALVPLLRSAPEVAASLGVSLRGARRQRDPEDDAARLDAAIAGLLAAWSEEQPLVLLLDDLQWADSGTLDAVRAIGRRLAPMLSRAPARVLVLATARSQEAEGTPVAALLRELDRDRVLARIALAGLGEAEIGVLVRGILSDAPPPEETARLASRSQGNPYFVEELCRDLEERRKLGQTAMPAGATSSPAPWSVPEQLKGVIDARLARLSPDCSNVLRIAALLGPRFRFDVLRDGAGLGDERALACVEEAIAARVLREEMDTRPVRYSFEHILVAEVLGEGLARPRRQRLHLALADALERRAPDAAMEIAHHLLEAGESAPDERLASWCETAGHAALGLHAAAVGVRLLTAALAARERLGQGDSADADRLRQALIPALGHLGEVDRARSLGERIIAAGEAAGDLGTADAVRALVARILTHHALPGEAVALLEPAVRRDVPPTPERGVLLAQYAVALDLVGDSSEMRQTAVRLLRLARRAGRPELEERALAVQRNWYANHTPRVGRALALSRSLLERAEARRDVWDAAVMGSDVGLFEFVTGRVGAALDTLERALAAATRMGALAAVVNVRAVRAMCFCFRGAWDQVESEWVAAAPLLGRVPGALRVGLLFWARTRSDLWRGRPGPKIPDTQQLYAGISQFQTDVLAGVGLVAAETGAPAAREILERVAARQPRVGSGVNWLTAAQAIAAGWAELGDAAHAEPWYDALLPYRGTLLAGCTELTLGRIARLTGRTAAAERHLARVVRLARREGLRPLAALALGEQAVLARMGRGPHSAERAIAHERESLAIAADLGMRHYEAERPGL